MSDLGGHYVASAIDRAIEKFKSRPLTEREFVIQFVLAQATLCTDVSFMTVIRACELWSQIESKTK